MRMNSQREDRQNCIRIPVLHAPTSKLSTTGKPPILQAICPSATEAMPVHMHTATWRGICIQTYIGIIWSIIMVNHLLSIYKSQLKFYSPDPYDDVPGICCSACMKRCLGMLLPVLCRTQMCVAPGCKNTGAMTQTRPVCFFAHTKQEQRKVDAFAVPLECMVSSRLSFPCSES